MERDATVNEPGHVRRSRGSGELVAFVEIPGAGSQPGSGTPSDALMRIVGMAMVTVSPEAAPIERLPHEVHVGRLVRAYARQEADGIRIGVMTPGMRDGEIPGILVREARDTPYGTLFTMEGRGATGKGCNAAVASHVLGTALLRMEGEAQAAWMGLGVADVPGLFGSLHEEAFPDWKPFPAAPGDEDEPGGPPSP